MPIVMMICFARSGGTVLNQCLGSLPNVIMLSEVHPLVEDWSNEKMSPRTIKHQAKNWYQIDLKSSGFVESVLELEEICQRSGRQLIIRDWTFGGYFPFDKNPSPPADKLLSLETLEGKCEVVPFCFVRDAIDVWISLALRLPVEMQTFFVQCLKYAQDVKTRNIPVFKYEDFVRNSEDIIHQICRCVGLEFSDSWKNYISYDKVTGDTKFDRLSRGRRSNIIRRLPRRRLSKKKIIEINQCEEMKRANELLGYPTSYYGVEQESMFSAISEKCNRFISRYPRGLIRRLRRWTGEQNTLYNQLAFKKSNEHRGK